MADTMASGPAGPPRPTDTDVGGSGGDEIQQRGAAGAGSTAIQKRRPGGLVPQRGRREMKEYPLTDSDLHDLRNIGLGATACFSLGSLCLGFWSNLYATLSFSDITKNLLAVGTARQQDALVAALFFYGVGFILLVMGYTRVAEIKAEVDFGGGRPRYTLAKIIFKTVVILALLAGAFWLGRYSLSAAPTKL